MITVRQASMFNGFRYLALDTNEQLLGQFEFPWRARAGNARLRWHERNSRAGDVQLAVRGESGQQSYQIRHDYLTRRTHPDMRYSLLQGDEVLASAEVLQEAGLRRPHIHLRQPFAAQLTRITSIRLANRLASASRRAQHRHARRTRCVDAAAELGAASADRHQPAGTAVSGVPGVPVALSSAPSAPLKTPRTCEARGVWRTRLCVL